MDNSFSFGETMRTLGTFRRGVVIVALALLPAHARGNEAPLPPGSGMERGEPAFAIGIAAGLPAGQNLIFEGTSAGIRTDARKRVHRAIRLNLGASWFRLGRRVNNAILSDAVYLSDVPGQTDFMAMTLGLEVAPDSRGRAVPFFGAGAGAGILAWGDVYQMQFVGPPIRVRGERERTQVVEAVAGVRRSRIAGRFGLEGSARWFRTFAPATEIERFGFGLAATF